MNEPNNGNVGILQAAIGEARALFGDGRETLESTLATGFVDSRSAVETLLSLADEYGPDHALDLLRERPLDFGEMRGPLEITEELALQVGALHSMQEQLDGLTAEREKQVSRGNVQAINIQGDEYTLDPKARELQSVDRPDERTRINLDHTPLERPGLADALAARSDVQLAQPRPRPERDWGRTR